jgi:5-enolpyruvylshikimate-3-phosphate synthase
MKVDSIKFDDKDVVNKSYPKFWEDFDSIIN